MLSFRYFEAKPVTCKDCLLYPCENFSRTQPSSVMYTCNFFKRKKIKKRKSVNAEMEWDVLNERLYMIRQLVEKRKDKFMRGWFLPDSLKTPILDDNNTTYTECCAFSDTLREYYRYINDNKIDLVSIKDRMSPLLNTVITLEDKVLTVKTEDKTLAKLVKEVIRKKYAKTIFFVVEKEESKWI